MGTSRGNTGRRRRRCGALATAVAIGSR
jgi:hypothetical protein